MSEMSEKIGATGRQGGQVCAVIVSYCPEPTRLRALIESVVRQADFVVIVDNGSTIDELVFLRRLADCSSIKLIEFGENRGIAAAHNAGIRYAMKNAFDYVLLLDHDSRLFPGCVDELLKANKRLIGSGIKVAAVGPQYNDDTSAQPAPFLRFSRWTFRKIYVKNKNEVLETSVLISSGSLIACATLQVVGLMDESLFIDGVDWEWCFRASALGYRLFGIAAAVMQHSLGDSGIRVLGRTLPLHSPLRHYYAYRNTVLMCRMAQVPFSWKLHFSLRLIVRFFIYLILAPRRRERCRMIRLGLQDGWQGRHGRLALPV
ncbi:MAG: glycosyltransferase family 2 protein [Burkholderiales bacterium]